MVKSKTSKMHLEINNDVDFDIRNESTSKRKRNSKKVKSTRRGKMPSILVNGKRIPLKSMSRNMSASVGTKRKAIKSSMKSAISSKQMSSGTKKRSRSSSIPKKSIKRSRSSMKSKSASGKLARDARGRFVEKSSTNKGKVSGAQKTIFMPIQQDSNGKTAEAIVIKNEESAKNEADVTDVKIVEK